MHGKCYGGYRLDPIVAICTGMIGGQNGTHHWTQLQQGQKRKVGPPSLLIFSEYGNNSRTSAGL